MPQGTNLSLRSMEDFNLLDHLRNGGGLNGDPKPKAKLTPAQIAAWNEYRKKNANVKDLETLHKGYMAANPSAPIDYNSLYSEFFDLREGMEKFADRRNTNTGYPLTNYEFPEVKVNGKSAGHMTADRFGGDNDAIEKLPKTIPPEWKGKLQWDEEKGLPYYGTSEDGVDMQYVHPSVFYSELNAKDGGKYEYAKSGKKILKRLKGSNEKDWQTAY